MLSYYYLNTDPGHFRFLILPHSLNQNMMCPSFVPTHSLPLTEVLLYCKYDIYLSYFFFICMYDVSNLNHVSNSIFIISIRDLNPLYDVTIQHDYREKYYKKLMPLSEKYSEVFQNPHLVLAPYIVRLYSTMSMAMCFHVCK
jgi:hypothetical protein